MRTIALFTTLVVLSVAEAAAAPPADVRDVFSDVLDPIHTVSGEILEHRVATLVLRGDDGTVYTINTAGLDAETMARLDAGRTVTVTLATGRPGAMPIATAVESDVSPSASIPSEPQHLQGIVQTVDLASLTMKTEAGRVVKVDTTQVIEPIRVRPGDPVSVVGNVKVDGRSERFVAERVQPADASAPAPGR